jgi:hypothetical protein
MPRIDCHDRPRGDHPHPMTTWRFWAITLPSGVAFGLVISYFISVAPSWHPECWHGRTVDSSFQPCVSGYWDAKTSREEDRQ